MDGFTIDSDEKLESLRMHKCVLCGQGFAMGEKIVAGMGLRVTPEGAEVMPMPAHLFCFGVVVSGDNPQAVMN